MIRYLVITFATLALLFTNAACTSKKVESDPDATAEMADDGSMDAVESDGGEMAEAGDAAEGGSSDFSEDDFGADESVADSGGAAEGGATEDSMASSDGFEDESTVSETQPTDEGTAAIDETQTADAGGMDAPTSDLGTETPTDTQYADSGSSLGGDEMGGLSEEPPAPKPVVPLKKIQTTPWTQAGVIVNAVYLARPGDDFKTVSQKIYGTDERASELRKVNPTIAARKMKVGDKVYYNSPRRPTDNMQLLTFYEDLGLSPEVYVAQPGDNVREVAKRLLGDDNSWKELWATNLDVESKGELPEGTRLRYWAGDLVAQAPAPAPEAPAPPPVADMNPEPEPAPPMPEEAPAPPVMAETAPPPPPSDFAPPPPPVAEAPPVPAEVQPPTDAGSDDPIAAFLGEGGDQTTALMIGAILLIAAVALFIIIRKRKARRNIDFQTATHTQLD